MAQEDCEINLANHYPNKNPQEIKNSVKYINAIRGRITDRGDLRIFMEDYAKIKKLELSSRLLGELDTVGKHAMNTDRILNPKWNGDHLQAALSIYEETSSVVPGAGINAERTIQVKQKAFWGSFITNMQKIGFQKEFQSGAFDKEIRDVIKTGKKFVGNGADKINQAAAIIKNSYSIMNHELNSAGMRTAYRGDYDGPIVHDGSAIYGKFKEWSTALDKALDFQKEFPEVPEAEITEFRQMLQKGELPEKPTNQVHKILDYSYRNITDSESMLRDELPRSLERPVSITERRSYAKSFTTWKDGAAISNYLGEFGKYKTLAEQMEYYSRSAARDVGLTSVLGASPYKGHEMNKELVTKRMRLDGEKSAKIEDAMKEMDIAFANIAKPKIPDPNTVGQILMHTRTVSAQAKLGMAGFTSLFLDPVTTASQRRILLGEGLVSSVYKSFSGYIPSISTAMRGDVEDSHLFSQYDLATTIEELHVMAGGVRSSNDKIGSALQLSGEIISKGSGAYFMNKVSHINNAKMYMKFLADASKGGTITPQMKADLGKFNLKEADLKIVEKLDLGGEAGMRNLFRLTPADMLEVHPEYGDLKNSAHALTSLQERMNLWLLEKIKSGAPIPGNRERRILHGDTTAGTVQGEFRRYLTQFKMTAAKVLMDSTYGTVRRMNPEGMQGGNVDWKNKETMHTMGVLAAHMTAAGAALLFTNAILSRDDKTIERFSKGDPSLLLDSFARGGGGFILGDIITMNSNRLANIAQLVGSPAVSALATPPAIIGNVGKGQSGKAVKDTFKTFVPGANMWFLKPFLSGMEEYSGHMSKHSKVRDNLFK